MLNKFDIFINKYVDALLFISKQKKIQKLLEKDVFKVVTLNKIVIPEKISINTQVFNFCLVNNIKDLYNDKAYK